MLIGRKELMVLVAAEDMVAGLCSGMETLEYGVARPMKLKEELKDDDCG